MSVDPEALVIPSEAPTNDEVRPAEKPAEPALQPNDEAPAPSSEEEVQRREQAKANAAFAAARQREREVREELARERAEKQALLALMQGNRQPEAPKANDGEPDPANYAGGEFSPEYLRDVAKYEGRRQSEAALRDHQERMTRHAQEEQARRQRQTAVENWGKSRAAAEAKFADFEVVVEASAGKIPQQAMLILANLPDGAELLYEAAGDSSKANALTGSPVQVAAALGELRAEVKARAAVKLDDDKPITPSRTSGSSNSEPDAGGEDVGRWIAWRRKQLGMRSM